MSVKNHLNFALFILTIFLAPFFIGGASANDIEPCTPTSKPLCDQGIAYSFASLAAETENLCAGFSNYSKIASEVKVYDSYRYTFRQNCRSNNPADNGFTTWTTTAKTWFWSGLCSSRPYGNIGMVNGTQTPTGVCNNGCKMVPNFDAGTNLTLTDKANSNAIVIRNGTWRPSGDVCSVEPPQPPESPEYCHTVDGGYQVCKRKDQTCVVTPSGFRTCASDTGNLTGQVQTNNQRTEAAGISGPNSQANGPQNRPGENWQSAGPGASITNNNGGNIININNFNNAGQANGNQPVPGDGSAAGGNTATGSGSTNGTGSGTGSGDGNGNDDGNSPGGSGAGVGELYEGTDKTVLGIMQGFKSHIEASNFGSSVTSFMSVQGGGACPAINITASEWWDAMSFTAHCEGAFLAFLRAVGYVIFAMACYIAIKIAVT